MNSDRNYPIILLGAGGHASVILDIMKMNGKKVIAIVAPEKNVARSVFKDLLHIRKDEDVVKYSPSEVRLVNGIGMLPGDSLRATITKNFSDMGYLFETVISPRAVVSSFCEMGCGVQVLHNAVVQAGVYLGAHTIINTNGVVEHDSVLGKMNHIAPSATICGGVKTGEGVFVGCGAVVLPGKTIDDKTIVKAGSVY